MKILGYEICVVVQKVEDYPRHIETYVSKRGLTPDERMSLAIDHVKHAKYCGICGALWADPVITPSQYDEYSGTAIKWTITRKCSNDHITNCEFLSWGLLQGEGFMYWTPNCEVVTEDGQKKFVLSGRPDGECY